MTRRPVHRPSYRGVRPVTVACHCGWISENHRSRGEARRRYAWHVWTAETAPDRPFWAAVDARRKEPR